LTVGSEEALGERPEQRSCRACGFRFINSAHGDCCSARCAQYLAEGNPSKAEQERRDNPFLDRRRFGPVGTYTNCRSCGHRFESRGLKFCAGCTNGGVVEKRDRATAAVKTQPCPVCGGDVPAFTGKGRKSRATFCSERCQKRHERGQGAGFVGDKSATATLVA
jgi:hypothetical protein